MSKISLDECAPLPPFGKKAPTTESAPSLLPETAFQFIDESTAIYEPKTGKWYAVGPFFDMQDRGVYRAQRGFGIAAAFVAFLATLKHEATDG